MKEDQLEVGRTYLESYTSVGGTLFWQVVTITSRTVSVWKDRPFFNKKLVSRGNMGKLACPGPDVTTFYCNYDELTEEEAVLYKISYP